jgi:hypothetical protein
MSGLYGHGFSLAGYLAQPSEPSLPLERPLAGALARIWGSNGRRTPREQPASRGPERTLC